MITAGAIAVALGLQVDSASFAKGSGALKRIAASARRYIEGEAVASVYRFLRSTTEAATQLVTLSQSMGLTVEQTQMWGYVAQQSGSNVKVLNEGLNMFIRNLKNLTLGKGSAMIKEQFASLGIDATKAKKALSGPDGLNEVLLQVADRVQAMGRTGNTAALTRLFGRDAGRALLGSFSRGRAGIESLMQRRRGMGLISEQDAKNSQELDNRIKDIKTAFSALAAVVVAKLAPSLIEMAKSAAKWIADNKDLISGALVIAVKFLAMAFRELGHVIAFVGYIVRQVKDGNVVLIAILGGVAAVIFAAVLPALQTMAVWFVIVSAAALQLAIDFVIAFAPAFAVGALIALLVVGLVELIKHWKLVGEALKGAWADAIYAGRAFLDWIEALPGRVGDAVADAAHFIVTELGRALDWVLTKAHAVWDDMEEIPIIGYAFRGIGDLAGVFTGDVGTSGQVAIRRMSAADAARAAGGGGGNNNITVTYGDTQINVKSVEEAKRAKEQLDAKRDQDLRHTMAGVGGRTR